MSTYFLDRPFLSQYKPLEPILATFLLFDFFNIGGCKTSNITSVEGSLDLPSGGGVVALDDI